MERPLGVALVAGWFVLGGVLAASTIRNYLYALGYMTSRAADIIIGGSIVIAGFLAIAFCITAAGLWRGAPRARPAAFVLLVLFSAILLLMGHYAIAAANAVALAMLLREKEYFAQRARSM